MQVFEKLVGPDGFEPSTKGLWGKSQRSPNTRVSAIAEQHLLGRSYELPVQWAHRLARCEVDLNSHQMRFFALLRRDPGRQSMLLQVPYDREHKPFYGELGAFNDR
jgi:hypothetical protein